jgi:hypothetical protein
MPDQLRSARAGRSLDWEPVDWVSVLEGAVLMFEFEPVSGELMPLLIPLVELFVESLGLVVGWPFWPFIPAEGFGDV